MRMSRKRTSLVWKKSKEEFKKIIDKSSSVTEALSHFELSCKGNNYKTLKTRMEEDGLDYAKLVARGMKTSVKKTMARGPLFKIPLSLILVEGSSYSRTDLKKRLMKNNILKNKCSICGQEPVWKNKKLTMVLDHINGVSNDNRLENLRLLCPNCNSQTETFAGKNTKYVEKKLDKEHTDPDTGVIWGTSKKTCIQCKKTFYTKQRNQKYCSLKCAGMYSRRVEHPTKEVLLKLVWKKPTTQLAKDFGVSDKAIEKWCKIYGIEKPGRGYWAKKRSIKT